MKAGQKKNLKWSVTRWLGGKVVTKEEGCACVARHLYMRLGEGSPIWCGVLSGMTDGMEKKILDALNNEQPPGKVRSHARSL